MAAEKNFENRLKKWLESEGIYPIGEAFDQMAFPPYGYYEKRWGGGMYQKSGLPDMRITINGIALEVELKAENGRLSKLQERNMEQINRSMGIALVLYPAGFEAFKQIVRGLKSCNSHILALRHLCDAHINSNCDISTR